VVVVVVLPAPRDLRWRGELPTCVSYCNDVSSRADTT